MWRELIIYPVKYSLLEWGRYKQQGHCSGRDEAHGGSAAALCVTGKMDKGDTLKRQQGRESTSRGFLPESFISRLWSWIWPFLRIQKIHVAFVMGFEEAPHTRQGTWMLNAFYPMSSGKIISRDTTWGAGAWRKMGLLRWCSALMRWGKWWEFEGMGVEILQARSKYHYLFFWKVCVKIYLLRHT